EYREKGRIKGTIVKSFNFEKPKQNEFLAINQFTIIENKINKRPDIILFVNGIPIVTIELKSPTNPKATIFLLSAMIGYYRHYLKKSTTTKNMK
ncbi:MAG: type I restriction enzyme R subunit, partial [Candidatus Woesearchaeota archaeon]